MKCRAQSATLWITLLALFSPGCLMEKRDDAVDADKMSISRIFNPLPRKGATTASASQLTRLSWRALDAKFRGVFPSAAPATVAFAIEETAPKDHLRFQDPWGAAESVAVTYSGRVSAINGRQDVNLSLRDFGTSEMSHFESIAEKYCSDAAARGNLFAPPNRVEDFPDVPASAPLELNTEESRTLAAARRAWRFLLKPSDAEIQKLLEYGKGFSEVAARQKALCRLLVKSPHFWMRAPALGSAWTAMRLELFKELPSLREIAELEAASSPSEWIRAKLTLLRNQPEKRPAYLKTIREWHQTWLGLHGASEHLAGQRAWESPAGMVLPNASYTASIAISDDWPQQIRIIEPKAPILPLNPSAPNRPKGLLTNLTMKARIAAGTAIQAPVEECHAPDLDASGVAIPPGEETFDPETSELQFQLFNPSTRTYETLLRQVRPSTLPHHPSTASLSAVWPYLPGSYAGTPVTQELMQALSGTPCGIGASRIPLNADRLFLGRLGSTALPNFRSDAFTQSGTTNEANCFLFNSDLIPAGQTALKALAQSIGTRPAHDLRLRRLDSSGQPQNGFSQVRLPWTGETSWVCNTSLRFRVACSRRMREASSDGSFRPLIYLGILNRNTFAHPPSRSAQAGQQNVGMNTLLRGELYDEYYCDRPDTAAIEAFDQKAFIQSVKAQNPSITAAQLTQSVNQGALPQAFLDALRNDVYLKFFPVKSPRELNDVAFNITRPAELYWSGQDDPGRPMAAPLSPLALPPERLGDALSQSDEIAFGTLVRLGIEQEPYHLLEYLLGKASDTQTRPYSELVTANYTVGTPALELYYSQQGYQVPTYFPALSELRQNIRSTTPRPFTLGFGFSKNWLRKGIRHFGLDNSSPTPLEVLYDEFLEDGNLTPTPERGGIGPALASVTPRTHAGILTQAAFIPPATKGRTVAARIIRRLLCSEPSFDSLLGGQAALHQQKLEQLATQANGTASESRHLKPACATCHRTLDPLAVGLFRNFGFDPQFRRNDIERYPSVALGYGEQILLNGQWGVVGSSDPAARGDGVFLGKRVQGFREVGLAIAESPLLSQCATQKAYENLVGHAVQTPDEARLIERVARQFREKNWNYHEMLEDLMTSPEVLNVE